jgi:hypothetical protein
MDSGPLIKIILDFYVQVKCSNKERDRKRRLQKKDAGEAVYSRRSTRYYKLIVGFADLAFIYTQYGRSPEGCMHKVGLNK